MLLQIIHITKRALVIAREFWNPLLSKRWTSDHPWKDQKASGENKA